MKQSELEKKLTSKEIIKDELGLRIHQLKEGKTLYDMNQKVYKDKFENSLKPTYNQRAHGFWSSAQYIIEELERITKLIE